MARVEQHSILHYTVHTANDCAGTAHEGYPKSWFYFSVRGFPRCIVKFVVKNLNMLWAVSKQPELYRPVWRADNGAWMRLEKPVQIYVFVCVYICVDQRQRTGITFRIAVCQ